MNEPNYDIASRFLTENSDKRLVHVAITGSHIYGFASADSDIDIKGTFIEDTHKVLGLGVHSQTVNKLGKLDGVECDLTLNELSVVLGGLLKGDGNMLERVLSPIQIRLGGVGACYWNALERLARGSISKRYWNHYTIFARSMQRAGKVGRHEHHGPPLKTVLYIYRLRLTLAHLLLTGEMEANLMVLAPMYGFHAALELVDRKQRSTDFAACTCAEWDYHESRLPKLEAVAADALAESTLPDEPQNVNEINEWLVSMRMEQLEN